MSRFLISISRKHFITIAAKGKKQKAWLLFPLPNQHLAISTIAAKREAAQKFCPLISISRQFATIYARKAEKNKSLAPHLYQQKAAQHFCSKRKDA